MRTVILLLCVLVCGVTAQGETPVCPTVSCPPLPNASCYYQIDPALECPGCGQLVCAAPGDLGCYSYPQSSCVSYTNNMGYIDQGTPSQCATRCNNSAAIGMLNGFTCICLQGLPTCVEQTIAPRCVTGVGLCNNMPYNWCMEVYDTNYLITKAPPVKAPLIEWTTCSGELIGVFDTDLPITINPEMDPYGNHPGQMYVTCLPNGKFSGQKSQSGGIGYFYNQTSGECWGIMGIITCNVDGPTFDTRVPGTVIPPNYQNVHPVNETTQYPGGDMGCYNYGSSCLAIGSNLGYLADPQTCAQHCVTTYIGWLYPYSCLCLNQRPNCTAMESTCSNPQSVCYGTPECKVEVYVSAQLPSSTTTLAPPFTTVAPTKPDDTTISPTESPSIPPIITTYNWKYKMCWGGDWNGPYNSSALVNGSSLVLVTCLSKSLYNMQVEWGMPGTGGIAYYYDQPTATCFPNVAMIVQCEESGHIINQEEKAQLGCFHYTWDANNCLNNKQNMGWLGSPTACAQACQQANPQGYVAIGYLYPGSCLCLSNYPTCDKLGSHCNASVTDSTYTCFGNEWCLVDAYDIEKLTGEKGDSVVGEAAEAAMIANLPQKTFYSLVIILPVAALVLLIFAAFCIRKRRNDVTRHHKMKDEVEEREENETEGHGETMPTAAGEPTDVESASGHPTSSTALPTTEPSLTTTDTETGAISSTDSAATDAS